MELLLHYVWQHRLFAGHHLTTTDGRRIDVIDPGLHNGNAGPDFFNAKVKIDDVLWVGNVELHERATDWHRHHHERDAAYNNVILHVCAAIDGEAVTLSGHRPPQTVISVPDRVRENYRELLEEDTYPPCWRVIPDIPRVTVHGWLSALTAERLEEKTERIKGYLAATDRDWERTFFITLARNFGFGINSEAFEAWALGLPLSAVAKHRDDIFQVEALFFGQAGLLEDEQVPAERRDDYFLRLQREYRYLARKFTLSPIDARLWRFLRLRPQNFPHIRLAQLVELYHSGRTDFSQIIAASGTEALRSRLRAGVTDYWAGHYAFGAESKARTKHLQAASIDLLLINTVAPLLFAYGQHHLDERLCERAFALLEDIKAEHNFITRSWAKAGITAANAADSQALIQLRWAYCDRKECLRCRFGCEYLRKASPVSSL